MTPCILQSIVDRPFAVITYTEAVDRLLKAKKKFEFPVQWGSDLQSEHERYLTEQEFSGTPLFVTDYPKDIKVSLTGLRAPSSCCYMGQLASRFPIGGTQQKAEGVT